MPTEHSLTLEFRRVLSEAEWRHIITLVNKEYMDPLYHTPTGHKLMLGGVVMMFIGTLLLKKIVSFRG